MAAAQPAPRLQRHRAGLQRADPESGHAPSGGDGARLADRANITTADSHAGSFTAACGVMIWRGGALPGAVQRLRALLRADGQSRPRRPARAAGRDLRRRAAARQSASFSPRATIGAARSSSRAAPMARSTSATCIASHRASRLSAGGDPQAHGLRGGKELGRIWRVTQRARPYTPGRCLGRLDKQLVETVANGDGLGIGHRVSPARGDVSREVAALARATAITPTRQPGRPLLRASRHHRNPRIQAISRRCLQKALNCPVCGTALQVARAEPAWRQAALAVPARTI